MSNGTVFKENKLIAALHFPPLPGYEGYTSMDEILEFSLSNAITLENAGFDSIIFENNYDIPHKIDVDSRTIEAMKYLIEKISSEISIPFGVSVLWNSYNAGFDIAKETGGKFIRVPVFVDDVETSYGKIFGDPSKVLEAREKLDAREVKIFADIQVKHSNLLNKRPIGEAATEAVKEGADAVIVTGNWTGDSPKMEQLAEVRQAVGPDFPVIIGSGATIENIKSLMEYASGVIVGTALKDTRDLSEEKHVNLVEPYIPISFEKSKEFVDEFRKHIN